MRFFEIMILGLLAFNLIRTFFTRYRGPAVQGLVWIGLILVPIHWITEGPRWQMYPAYLVAALLMISYYTLEAKGSPLLRLPLFRWSGATLITAMLVITFSLPILLPVPQLQEPGGDYVVGTKTLHLIDPERIDPYAPDSAAQRELMVQIWYPTEPDSTDEYAPWMDSAHIVAPEIAGWLELRTSFLDHLRYAESKALLDAEPIASSDPFPLLLFSHGYGGFRAQNTNQAQELASRGFIVIGVEHTYGAVITVFPDGRVAMHNPDTLPDGLSEPESLIATRALGAQWAQDLQFVVDMIVGLNSNELNDFIGGSVDTERLGAFGHSTGGGAAIEFCARDGRCDAVLTMDPYMKPVSAMILEQGLGKPAFHMFSEAWPKEENIARFDMFRAVSSGSNESVFIQGTAHYDFSDLPLLTPIAHQIGLKGPLSGGRVIEIVNSLSVSFFTQVVGDNASGNFSLAVDIYPEVLPFSMQ